MKNIHKTILPINNTTSITIFHRTKDHQLNCSLEGSIVLIHDNVKTILADGFVYHHLRQLTFLLQKALLGQLMLDEGITKDLGYLFNEYSAIICGEKKEKSTDLVYIQKNNESYWPGIDYSLWAYDVTSWIYNKPDGSIIFEVTPFYPYMYCEPEEEPHYIPYQEWITTYKPYFATTLSKEIAQQWLEQTQHIITMLLML